MTDVLIKDLDPKLEWRLRDEAARGDGDLGEAAKRLLGRASVAPPDDGPTDEEINAMPLGQALRAIFKPVHDDPRASAALEEDLKELAETRRARKDSA